jgi:hypothetical protein
MNNFNVLLIVLFVVTFSCPPLPSMATTQPTPQPPNPTTDSEETPPTTNQQTQEPIDPLTTTSTDSETSSSPLNRPTDLDTGTVNEITTSVPCDYYCFLDNSSPKIYDSHSRF